jgi:hypothetical protein
VVSSLLLRCDAVEDCCGAWSLVLSFTAFSVLWLSTEKQGFDQHYWNVGGTCLSALMNARMARMLRAARQQREAVRVRVLDEAYLEANRAEVRHITVERDSILGGLVDGLTDSARAEARAAGWKLQQVYAVVKHCETHTPVVTSEGMRAWDQKTTARRVAVSEVALALRIPERTAQNLIEEARMLTERLPLTMTGLLAGDFSYRHAKVVVDHARSLPEELQADFEAAIIPSAAKLTVSKFDLKARTARERMDPATITERHIKAVGDRETFFEPARDGMGWLHLYNTAAVTLAAYNRAEEMAHELQGPTESRTLTQLRADVVTDLLLDGAVGDRPEFRIRPSVTVTVPVLSMLGHKSRNGEVELPVLEGYGPIDIDTATSLAGAGKSWLRVLTHPETGVMLSVGRDRYTVPADLRAFLRQVDGTCRKPGCNRPAARCDLDHTQEWQHGGQTAHDNLEHLCPMHHAEKHHTGAQITHQPNGDIQWTMPSGRTYISEPADRYITPADFLNPADAA